MLMLGKIRSASMIAIVSLGVTSAAPAQAADTEDILGVIVGLAAIAAIADRAKDDDRGKVHRSYRDNRSIRHYNSKKRNRFVLPEHCLRRSETRRGLRTVLPVRCLERSGVRTSRLPHRCERRAELRRGVRNVFGARCRQRVGYTVGQRHNRRW